MKMIIFGNKHITHPIKGNTKSSFNPDEEFHQVEDIMPRLREVPDVIPYTGIYMVNG